MQPIYQFNVSPALPPKLEPLRRLAYNLHWDWNSETTDLFRRLDPDLWEATRYNPARLLGFISQSRLREAAEDEGFIAHMERAVRQLDSYLAGRDWYRKQRSQPVAGECYAYFSMEFGLTSCLPIYSGGLGVLAGDHLKSASDLGLPLVGVGLLYQEGYFSQYLNVDGWQQEHYPINDFYNMPLHPERDADGNELRIVVDYPDRQVYARVWRVQVGAVPLYLLDTNIEPNQQYDHDITDRLYGGDTDMRIHQEMMLGIGGVRLLEALGLSPSVYHMNEGHSAFLSLERIQQVMDRQGLAFAEAKELVRASQLFTTHTPVPAGIDLFPADKIVHYLGRYGDRFGLSREEFLALGRERTGDLESPFSMAILAIKMASFVNGVSQLHGQVSQGMFQNLWAGLPLEEVPIAAITNGVHARSCVAKINQELYERYLGPKWVTAGSDRSLWERVYAIPDEELWRNHERCRSELVVFARDWLARHLQARGASPGEIASARELLDPNALTIGFARRFATYKRATLFLRDRDRLVRLLTDKQRPVQFAIAGKAHPKDEPGKNLIRDIVHFARDAGVEDRLVFLPNYDIHLSRSLVAGADVWLNNPRRPREASGTSGMKAAANGLLNLSILDGWWAEADYVSTGWAIGSGEEYADPDYQDEVEANALYDLLEQEVVPLFYDRDADELPRGWIAKMKDAIRLNCPQFNTSRMLSEYANRGYFPASDRYDNLRAADFAAARDLAQWKADLFDRWYDIKIEAIDVSAPSDIQVDQTVSLKARLNLGGLSPEDVRVELYKGPVNDKGDIVNGQASPMDFQGKDGEGNVLYTAEFLYAQSGLQGLSLRVLPQNPNLSSPYEMGLVRWAD